MHETTQNSTVAPSWAQGLLQRKCACGGSKSSGHEECDECAAKSLQRKANGGAQHAAAPAGVAAELHSPGSPLDRRTQRAMGRSFGHDFSNVRIHTDSGAAESARSVNALAYTVGDHIVFGAGHYAPHTRAGKHLLAHELAHTIQQENSTAHPQGKLQIQDSGSSDEVAADRAADAVVQGRSVGNVGVAGLGLQRKGADAKQEKDLFACDEEHEKDLDIATSTAVSWLSAVNRWFDAHLRLVKSRQPIGENYKSVGATLYEQLTWLDKYFDFGRTVRTDWRSRFPDSPNWEGNFKEINMLGRASYFIRRNFMNVRVSDLVRHCQKTCPKTGEGAEWAGSAVAGSREYSIYTNCFDPQSAKAKAGTVLHEAFHASFASFSGDTYLDDKQGFPGGHTATNADSYANFASFIATGSPFRVQATTLSETVIKAGAAP